MGRKGDRLRLVSLSPRLSLSPSPNELGQSEIQNLRVPVARHHNVFRLQVAMHDSGRMSFGQTLGHVLQVSEKLAEIGLALPDKFAQREAIDKFHGDKADAI